MMPSERSASRTESGAVTGSDSTHDRSLKGTLSDTLKAELIAFRRDLHMHPELGHQEFRTTSVIRASRSPVSALRSTSS